MKFGEQRIVISAKPLFIGSIPIAASSYNIYTYARSVGA